jgi:hypothetical protein
MIISGFWVNPIQIEAEHGESGEDQRDPEDRAEPFTAAGRPVGPAVADFWHWSRSDLLDNTERGVLAEFIVAIALGIPADGMREGWAAWDLTTPDGVRVEVKSAAYLQSWVPEGALEGLFNTPRTLAWDADGGGSPKLPGDMPRCPCSRCWPIPTRPRWIR